VLAKSGVAARKIASVAQCYCNGECYAQSYLKLIARRPRARICCRGTVRFGILYLFGSAIDHLHSLVCGHMTGGYPVYMGIARMRSARDAKGSRALYAHAGQWRYVNEGFLDPNHSIPSGPRAAWTACFIHTSGIDPRLGNRPVGRLFAVRWYMGINPRGDRPRTR